MTEEMEIQESSEAGEEISDVSYKKLLDYFESLTKPPGAQASTGGDKPPSMTLGETRECQVDPNIRYGDDRVKGDTAWHQGAKRVSYL